MDLSAITTGELERFAEAVASGRLEFPWSTLALRSEGAPALAALAGKLNGAGRDGALAVVTAALAERRALGAGPELVWTGPELRQSAARDTAVVLADLFTRAQKSVLLAGFAFDHGAELLRPLHGALGRGVICRIFADAEVAKRFIGLHWPFGPPFPEVFGFEPEPGVFASLHAKCVIADERFVFITSANFTDRGQTRNIEVGVLIDDAKIATMLEVQFSAERWFRRTEGC